MRFDIGFMDMYLFEACGTGIENNPMFKISLKRVVDPIRLEDAVYRAIKFHPLFGTQLLYDKYYYLQTNNRPIILLNKTENERPKSFGNSTNGYPWRICWDDKVINFEWCHGVTDGRGALEFIKTVLSIYCGVSFPEVPRTVNLGLGWEPFVDRNIKTKFKNKEASCFKRKIPTYQRGYRVNCNYLTTNTKDLISISRKNDGSPSVLLAVLLSQAIRKHQPERRKNKNIICNIAVDLRKPLQYETMHNCDIFSSLTFYDLYENQDLKEICRDYKAKLDVLRSRENIIKVITGEAKLVEQLYKLPMKWMRHGYMHLFSFMEKRRDCDCQITYLGKTDFSKEVNDIVNEFQFCVYPDFGDCTLAAIDNNGVFTVNICDNYLNKEIIKDFIKLSEENGINWIHHYDGIYEQGHFEEEKRMSIVKKQSHQMENGERREFNPTFREPLSSPTVFL